MTILEWMLEDIGPVAILGYICSDGDCLSFILRLYSYLRLNYPDIQAAVYLEEPSPKFSYLKGYDTICHQVDGECYGLCVCLGSGDIQRLGDFKHYLNQADKSLCLDHHVANTRYGDTNVVPDEASSAYEVLFDQLDEGKPDRCAAECLCTDITHDTGMFKFSCTSAHIMEIADKLVGKGVDFRAIIDNSFYRETYIQNRTLGRTLLEDITLFDRWCIFNAIHQSEMRFYGVDGKGMNGIIDQLCLTEGMEATIFLCETRPQEFKVSMRFQYLVDVSRTAAFFGDGGHVKAAGYSISGSIRDVISSLSVHIVRRLDTTSGSQE